MITTVLILIISIIPFSSSLLFIILPTHLIVVGVLGWVEIHQTPNSSAAEIWLIARRNVDDADMVHGCCREHICARLKTHRATSMLLLLDVFNTIIPSQLAVS